MSYPSLWGPAQWHLLHRLAFNADSEPENRAAFRDYVVAMQKILPCSSCAEHLKRNLAAMPMPSVDEKGFHEWSWRLHNAVNRANGTRELPLSECLEEMIKWEDRDISLENTYQARCADQREIQRLRELLPVPGKIMFYDDASGRAAWRTGRHYGGFIDLGMDLVSLGDPSDPDHCISYRAETKIRSVQIRGDRVYAATEGFFRVTSITTGHPLVTVPLDVTSFALVGPDDAVVIVVAGPGGLEILEEDRSTRVFEAATVVHATARDRILFANGPTLYWYDGHSVEPIFTDEVDIRCVWGSKGDWSIGTDERFVRNGKRVDTYTTRPIVAVRGSMWYNGEAVCDGEAVCMGNMDGLYGERPLLSITYAPNWFVPE